MNEYSLLEWSLIPWKNKDFSFGHGNKYPLGLRTWLKINGENIEIRIKNIEKEVHLLNNLHDFELVTRRGTKVS